VTEHIVVPEDRAGLELDEFLCLLYPEWNKGFVRRLVREGVITVDGMPATPSQRLRPHQVCLVDTAAVQEPPAPPVAPGIEVPILYEDEDVMVVDKPAGLAVEPERWARDRGSLSGALLQLARERAAGVAERGLDVRPRLVHRIDKDTSGAVVVAKNLAAERRLRRAFDRGGVHKVYLALVEGEFPLELGATETIDLPIGPDERRTGRQTVRKRGGKPARTRVSIERRFRGFTLLRCEPLTGRAHQIRVHLAARGFPLVVDPFYGRSDSLHLSRFKPGYRPKRGRPERPLIARLTLHALEVGIPGEGGDAEVRVRAPLHKDFAITLKQLEKHRSLLA
jgi:23S rRNA pseudouridine1911/1915/1917 synthase